MVAPTALYLPGTTGNGASMPNHAGIRITGDISVLARIASEDYTHTESQAILSLWTATMYYCYSFFINTSGGLTLGISDNGTAANIEYYPSSSIIPVSDGEWIWVGVTWDASASEAKFWTSSDGITWSQLGSAITGIRTSIFNSGGTGPLTVGSANANSRYLGKIQIVKLFNGIGSNTAPGQGTQVAEFDSRAPVEPRYRDSVSGQIWTFNGSAYAWEEVV